MSRLTAAALALAVLLGLCTQRAAAQPFFKKKSYVVADDIPSSYIQGTSDSGKGLDVGRTQVIKQCNDECTEQCSQQVDTKCTTIPFQKQVCVDKAYSDNTTSCRKECTTVSVPTTTVVTTGKSMPMYSKGKESYGWKGLRRLTGVPWGHSKGKGYVPAQVSCNDVCVDVPIVKYRQECQTITKERQACTDYINKTCKKVCKPVCQEFTNQVPVPATYGKKGL